MARAFPAIDYGIPEVTFGVPVGGSRFASAARFAFVVSAPLGPVVLWTVVQGQRRFHAIIRDGAVGFVPLAAIGLTKLLEITVLFERLAVRQSWRGCQLAGCIAQAQAMWVRLARAERRAYVGDLVHLWTNIAWRLGKRTVYPLEGTACAVRSVLDRLLHRLLWLCRVKPQGQTGGRPAGVHAFAELVFVPALTGLGAPHWDADAPGA